jgi:hypothetical protein
MARLIRVSLVLLFFMSTTAYGATVLALGPQDLAERSEQIFIGVVTGQATYMERSPDRVWTKTIFDVERSLKGPTAPQISITQLGGEKGTGPERLLQVVHGYPRFEVGERVLLFLERTDTGRLVVTGLAQGKYSLTADRPNGGIVATRDTSDLALRGAPAKADAHVAGMPTSHDRLLLTQLESLIRGERPTPAPLRVRPRATVFVPEVLR